MPNHMANTNRAPGTNQQVSPPQSESPPNEWPQHEWIVPRPQPIPRPTYMPITVAIGGTCILWGFLTSFIVSIVGLIFFVFGIIAWSGELWHGK